VRFGAACALAKYLGVNDQRISDELKTGLKVRYDTSGPLHTPRQSAEDGLEQLMAMETLQRVGPAAKPMVPALLDCAHATQDDVLREYALSIAGQIDGSLRTTMPDVDQAMRDDPTLKNAVPKK
jgi:hypothetical protein